MAQMTDKSADEGAANLPEYVLARISAYGDRVALVESESGEELSYAEITRRVLELGRRLSQLGLGRGSRVALCVENCLHYGPLLLGILQAGATAALYPPQSTPRELEHLISITKPSVIISSSLRKEVVEAASSKETWLIPLGELLERERRGSSEEEPVELCPSELSSPALLLASSGSTGLPKAVVIKHSNLVWAVSADGELLMEENHSALGLMPFYHAYGLGLMLMALCQGSPLVIMNKFNMKDFLSALLKYKISRLHLVPSLLVTLASDSVPKSKLRWVKAVVTGAGAVSPKVQAALLNKLQPGARLFHSYGMTETTHIVSFGEVHEDKPGSAGLILSCMRAKVVDDEGKEVRENEQGELWLQGPLVSPGYLENPSANSESFTADRWLRTGDLARIDRDGHLFVVDRIKDIIKYQGYQISASELEGVILEQGGVSEVAVVGVSHESFGEVPRAFVVPDPAKEVPSEEQIKKAVAKELSYYKWLRGGVKFVDCLPKTQSMKVNKKLLRSMQ